MDRRTVGSFTQNHGGLLPDQAHHRLQAAESVELAPVEAQDVHPAQGSREPPGLDVSHQRARIQDHDQLRRQGRHVVGDRASCVRVGEVVARDVDGVAVPVLDRTQ